MKKATSMQSDGKAEIEAIGTVFEALRNLDSAAQLRVLKYCAGMFGLELSDSRHIEGSFVRTEYDHDTMVTLPPVEPSSDDVEGINAVALKWMKRSNLSSKDLQKLFSLGIDEIDLVAKSVPGSSKRERMRNVLLLKGIAAYLSSGTPRITYEQLKEAALHYNAYDSANFAAALRSFAPDVGGTKESGYTLTARGLTTATSLVKDMVASP